MDKTQIIVSDLLKSKDVEILGNPQEIDSPYGKAVLFNGVDDALFWENNPLMGLSKFTIEVIMRPDSKGLTEQRFFHFGEVQGDRLMMETRLTDDGNWYLDGYVKSGNSDEALIDPRLLHPVDEWYHVALVFNNGQFSTYVNREKQLEGKVDFTPFGKGRFSIGVRQNKVCWYKGAFYKILITADALKTEQFIQMD